MVEETIVNAMVALDNKKAKKKRKKLDSKQDKDLALKKQRKKEKRREKQNNEKSSTNIKNKCTSTLPTTKAKDSQTNAPAKQIAFKTTKAASTKNKAQAKPNGKSTHEQTAKTISKTKTPTPKKTSDVPSTIPQLQSSNPPVEIRTETTIGTANRAIPRVDAAAQTDAANSSNETLPTLLDLLLQKKVFQKEQYQRKLCHVEKEIQQITRLQKKEQDSHVATAWPAKSIVTSTEHAKASPKFPVSNVSITNLQNSTDVSDDIIANTAKVDGEYSANANTDGNGYSNDIFGSNLSANTQPLSDSEDDMHENIIISKATDRKAWKPRGEEIVSFAKQRKDPPPSKPRRQKATEFPDFPHNTDFELAPEIYKLDPNESSIEDDSKDSDFELES